MPDLVRCPDWGGVLISGVSFKRGSTVEAIASPQFERTPQPTLW